MLRTPSAWVDRARVWVAFQIKDPHGNVEVVEPRAVILRISHASRIIEYGCNMYGIMRAHMHHVGTCTANWLHTVWSSQVCTAVAEPTPSVRLRCELACEHTLGC